MEKKTTETKTAPEKTKAKKTKSTSSKKAVKESKTAPKTKSSKGQRNYSVATVVLLVLVILEAVMMKYPCFGDNSASAMINVLKGKDLYSVAVALFMCLPLAVMFVATVLPVDVIKKYVICFFMTVWMLFGYLLLSMLFKAKYDPSKPALGLIMGIVFAVALLLTVIIGNITDKSSQKHKGNIWYNGFNKIVLFISLPALASLSVAVFEFKSMIFSFPVYPIIGIFTAIGTLVLCAFIAILSLFGKNKVGILYYIVAFTSVVSIMAMFILSDSLAMTIALVFSAILALFFIYLGHIAKRTYF